MRTVERRLALRRLLGAGATMVSLVSSASGANTTEKTPAEAWLDGVLITKGLDRPLALSRFVEPWYYLLEPFTWTPNKDNGPKYTSITVPRGFVTDLASIPPPLFSVLRADGEYAQAAILHDFLYWFQTFSREMSDDIFRVAMRDLEVSPHQISVIHAAVRSSFGQKAWDDNIRRQSLGERRLLKKFPTAAATRWASWKNRSDVFY